MSFGHQTTVDVQQVRIPPKRVREKHHDPRPLAESIAEVGLLNPITVNTDLTLISGFHRLEAVKLLGWTEIPAVVLDLDPVLAEVAEIDENLRRHDLTVWEQSKHISRREELMAQHGQRREPGGDGSNQHQSNSATVAGLLPKTTAELAAEVGLSERTYQSRAKVGRAIAPAVAAVIDDIDPETSSLPDSTRQLNYLAGVADPSEQLDIVTRVADGTARDVFEASSQLKLERRKEAYTATVKTGVTIPPVLVQGGALPWLERQEEVDLLLTDPPYMTDVDDIHAFAKSWLPLALSKVKNTGRAYVFIGAYPEELNAYLTVAMPTQVLVWAYKNTLGPNPRDRYKSNWQAVLYYAMPKAPPLVGDELMEKLTVHEVNAPDGRLGDRYHAWQKPLELAERFIRQSTREGDTVIDPFAGTGTFLLAAGRLGRRAFGCDLSAAHVAIARERGCE